MKRAVIPAICLLLVLSLSCLSFALDRITIRLKWFHSVQFAGIYAAEERGLFAEAGLEVELVDGPAADPELRALADGAFDFVLADSSRHLALVSQGVANVAVAAVFQIDPAVLFALSESGIRRPEDLVGKRIMAFPTSYVPHAVLGRVGLSTDDVELGPRSHDLSELYSGVYDVWSGYFPNEVLQAREDGYDVNVIYPTDYGVHLYGDVLIARRNLVEANPGLVQRVVTALLEGWTWVLDHIDEAAALALAWDPALDLETQRSQLRASIPFIYAGEVPFGAMTDRRWASMAAMMIEFGLLPDGFDVHTAYDQRFTMRPDSVGR